MCRGNWRKLAVPLLPVLNLPRFVLILFATCATCLLLIAFINCFVDVNGVYHPVERSRFAAAYVAALRSSPRGLIFVPYERSVKLALLRSTDADCYLTGSSQEMQMTLGNFAPAAPRCESLINIAVSGATFEDLITHIGELARHAGLRTLYVGIGPWMLRRGADPRWTEERAALRRACAELGLPSAMYRQTISDRLKVLRNAINSDYLRRNLQALLDRRPLIGAVDQLGDADDVMRPDGSFQYSRQFLGDKPPPPQSVGDGSYNIGQPYADAAVVEDMTAALTVLARRGVHVVFLFAPYHPKVLSCRREQVCESMATVVGAVRVLASRVGADVLGSFDPAVFGLTWRDFYDDMHVSAEALGRLRWSSSTTAPITVSPSRVDGTADGIPPHSSTKTH